LLFYLPAPEGFWRPSCSNMHAKPLGDVGTKR